ncbi:MAG: four helix bundle protein [Flavobacteriaceae bacterium]|nr:four helix bundle protein [Flavobacteriaceae bacterium]
MNHNFKKLQIWKRSMQLSIEIHKLTNSFPTDEKFSLISQLRRAAVSIHSNISEGSGRSSNKDFSRFLFHSTGSLCELESQLIYAYEVGYLDLKILENFQNEIQEIQNMIYAFESNLPK